MRLTISHLQFWRVSKATPSWAPLAGRSVDHGEGLIHICVNDHSPELPHIDTNTHNYLNLLGMVRRRALRVGEDRPIWNYLRDDPGYPQQSKRAALRRKWLARLERQERERAVE